MKKHFRCGRPPTPCVALSRIGHLVKCYGLEGGGIFFVTVFQVEDYCEGVSYINRACV